MVLISLIENAFKHGISPTEPSFIHINISATPQTIVCHIENSNHPKTADDHSGHGIGLQQVQQRLELAYPGRHTWQHGTIENATIYYSIITIQL
jgi:LytS/YehU family sensor histidine kinase